jgi:uncharacterized protein (TIGR02266 family)
VEPEQRRFARQAIAVEFHGKSAEGLGYLLFEGSDLSAGGTFLKSDVLLELGESVALEFQVPGVSRPLRTQARVAWVRRFPKTEEVAGMGVEFSAMSDQDRAVLSEYLASLHGHSA